MQVSDPRVEERLAHADELPPEVERGMRIAYASRQRMVEQFTLQLQALLEAQDKASRLRASVRRMQEPVKSATPSSADETYMRALDEVTKSATYAERMLDTMQEEFIKKYAAENRLEVRF